MLVDSTVPIIFSGTMRLADRVWVLPSPWGQSKTATEAGLGQAQSRAEHPWEGLATAVPNITWNSCHEVKQTKWQHNIRQLSISRRWNFVDTRGQINEKVKAYIKDITKYQREKYKYSSDKTAAKCTYYFTILIAKCQMKKSVHYITLYAWLPLVSYFQFHCINAGWVAQGWPFRNPLHSLLLRLRQLLVYTNIKHTINSSGGVGVWMMRSIQNTLVS